MGSIVTSRLLHAAPLALALLLTGCGGGGGSAPQTPQPTATPTPQGKPSISPSSVQITSAASFPTVTLSEPGYSGGFSVNASGCSGIASVTAVTGTSYGISPIAPGQCAVSFTDSFSQSVALPVSVTISQVAAQ